MGKHPSKLLRYSLTPKGYIDPIEKGLYGDLWTLLSTSFAANRRILKSLIEKSGVLQRRYTHIRRIPTGPSLPSRTNPFECLVLATALAVQRVVQIIDF